MKALASLRRGLDVAFRVLVGLAFAALLAAVTVQVVGRALGASPVWTEELARFALLYLAAFGTCLGLASGDLVDVDVVRSAVPAPAARGMRALGLALTAALSFGLLPAAWLYTGIGVRQTSPALGWRMDFLHASVLVLLAALGLFAALALLELLLGGGDAGAGEDPDGHAGRGGADVAGAPPVAGVPPGAGRPA